jgi:hypothetical protein
MKFEAIERIVDKPGDNPAYFSSVIGIIDPHGVIAPPECAGDNLGVAGAA